MTPNPDFDVDAYCDNLAKAGTEHAEQRAFFGWLLLMQHRGTYPRAGMAYAIPNGGKRDAVTASRLKVEGVKPGVPDICFPVPIGTYAGLYIEMKIKGGTVSDSQKAWRDALRECGYAAAVCWGWRQARECFITYNSSGAVSEDYR
jgi:hypothetical protein